jgi:alpha-aminoadipate carrier protein LysW
MTECPVCGAVIELEPDTIQGELKDCADCGTELEVAGIGPFVLKEAPQEEEDWGE